MERIFKLLKLNSAGEYLWYTLALFLLAFISACRQPSRPIQLVSNNGRATGIFVPWDVLKEKEEQDIDICLKGNRHVSSILGSWVRVDDGREFRPLISLSPGLTYDVWRGPDLLASLTVPAAKGTVPVVSAIYPQSDTVPENLLKIYIQFSRPMRTGNALDHIYLLDKNRDTMQRVFLNLQPELWDSTGTVLTLWLDPGRIKRDLVLNRELGNPLKKTQTYQLLIVSDWKDTQGLPLSKTYTKQFTVAEHDGGIPDINKWQLTIPKPGSNDPLIIKSPEPLDHYLFAESVAVIGADGKMLYSQNLLSDKDRVLKIIPLPNWETGKYRLVVKARLEDLAGNNLNRVFDRDIRKDKQQNKDIFDRGFEVK